MKDSNLIIEITTDDTVYLASGGAMKCDVVNGPSSSPVTVKYKRDAAGIGVHVTKKYNDALDFQSVDLTIGKNFFTNLSPQAHEVSHRGLKILFKCS